MSGSIGLKVIKVIAIVVALFVAFVIVMNIVMTHVEFANLQRKAGEGDAYAQELMGWYYENGSGVEKDVAKACEWYRKAAEQGDKAAQMSLAMIYEYGSGGVAKNDVEAFEWYRRLAEQGDAHAQNKLARIYLEGRGVKKDASKAYEWLRKAAEKGDTVAIVTIESLNIPLRPSQK